MKPTIAHPGPWLYIRVRYLAQDGFQVLGPQAATFNSSFSASDYVPDAYCLVRTVEDGLRKCRLGRSSCLPVPATTVGDERGSTAHLPAASLRPHLQRTHQPPLAPGSGQSTVEDGRAHVLMEVYGYS